MNQCGEVSQLLQSLRDGRCDDEIVSFSWNGTVMKAGIARPKSGKKMMVATFDGSDDFTKPTDEVIAEIRAMADKHFAEPTQ